jgi:hypothetical protein
VRCLQHYFQTSTPIPGTAATSATSAAAASSPAGNDCRVHPRDLAPLSADEIRRVYPCCGQVNGSKGCTEAPHLPMFQTIDGQIQPQRRIDYGTGVDLKSVSRQIELCCAQIHTHVPVSHSICFSVCGSMFMCIVLVVG